MNRTVDCCFLSGWCNFILYFFFACRYWCVLFRVFINFFTKRPPVALQTASRIVGHAVCINRLYFSSTVLQYIGLNGLLVCIKRCLPVYTTLFHRTLFIVCLSCVFMYHFVSIETYALVFGTGIDIGRASIVVISFMKV